MNESIPNIVPYFILQYVDERAGIYRGYIVAANSRKNEKNEIVYDYKIDTNVFRPGWRVVNKFYALNPLFRPIPTGMNLYCVEHSSSTPMKISALYKDYDIFTVNKQNCTFFITYGQPVVNTVSLYFHNVGENGLFPTFERDPPYGENDWTNVKFSPIFVMTSFSMDTNLDEESSKYDQSIRFRCMNKKCVPWTDHQPDIYKTKGLLAQKSIPIFECAVTCNQNLIEDEIDKDTVEGKTHSPKSVLSMVKSLNSQGGNIQNTIQNAFGPLISLFAIIFLAMMFILIAMILRNKKKNFR